eukprot:scaffold351_cov371-Prasinococcus_capsulatus_cf.AAC.22
MRQRGAPDERQGPSSPASVRGWAVGICTASSSAAKGGLVPPCRNTPALGHQDRPTPRRLPHGEQHSPLPIE